MNEWIDTTRRPSPLTSGWGKCFSLMNNVIIDRRRRTFLLSTPRHPFPGCTFMDHFLRRVIVHRASREESTNRFLENVHPPAIMANRTRKSPWRLCCFEQLCQHAVLSYPSLCLHSLWLCYSYLFLSLVSFTFLSFSCIILQKCSYLASLAFIVNE